MNEKQHMDDPNESLLLQYIKGNVTANEKRYINNWIQENEENRKTFSQILYLYHAQQTHDRIKNRDSRQAFSKVSRQISRRRKIVYLKRIAIAASLIIGILGISTFLFQKEAVAPALITINSNKNSHTDVVLPDGTKVLLNSGSSLTYPSYYSGEERKVTLKGEAYFNVSHNPEQPFIVGLSNNKMNIRVLGTEFNVNAYEESDLIETTLISGSIQLKTSSRNNEIFLEPSQKATYSVQSNQIKVETTETDREIDWMFNRLVFRETPMREVLKRLSKFYTVEFDVKTAVIYDYTFTGIFEDKPLYQVLDYMKISSQINYLITYKKDQKGTTKSIVELRK